MTARKKKKNNDGGEHASSLQSQSAEKKSPSFEPSPWFRVAESCDCAHMTPTVIHSILAVTFVIYHVLN